MALHVLGGGWGQGQCQRPQICFPCTFLLFFHREWLKHCGSVAPPPLLSPNHLRSRCLAQLSGDLLVTPACCSWEWVELVSKGSRLTPTASLLSPLYTHMSLPF